MNLYSEYLYVSFLMKQFAGDAINFVYSNFRIELTFTWCWSLHQAAALRASHSATTRKGGIRACTHRSRVIRVVYAVCAHWNGGALESSTAVFTNSKELGEGHRKGRTEGSVKARRVLRPTHSRVYRLLSRSSPTRHVETLCTGYPQRSGRQI